MSISENKFLGIIKKNAVTLYKIDLYNYFGNDVPESKVKFEKVIKSLEGQIFFIENEKVNSVFLKYPESMVFNSNNGKKVEGVELHKNLVDIYRLGESLK